MNVNLDCYSKKDMIQIMRNMDIPCYGKVISKKSKYCGQTFAVSWAGYWGICLKVMPINRDYNYVFSSIEITDKSINNFKRMTKPTIDGAVDYFKRQLKAEDIIFYAGELYRIGFFVESDPNKNTYYTKNVSLNAIRPREDWEGFEDHSEFLNLGTLEQSLLIDDPLLLLKY